MPKVETGAKIQEQEKEGRADTIRPPADLPDGSPLARMTELTRRVIGVPKDEAIAPKGRDRKHA